MLRTMMVALFASASVAMLAPDVASARGGFGVEVAVSAAVAVVAAFTAVTAFVRGGFRGGGMGMGGGGFRAAAIGGGGFRGAAIGPGGFRSAGFGGAGFRAAAFAPAAGFRGGTLAVNWRRVNLPGGFHNGFRHRRFPFVGAVGLGLGYGSTRLL